jgi:hypothetical protein
VAKHLAKHHSVRLSAEQMEDRVVPSIDLTGVEWRTITGVNNNLTVLNPRTGLFDQGAAETRQIRFGYGVEFTDADTTDIGNVLVGPNTVPARPNARTVSNAIHAQSGSVISDAHLTDWAFQWGQWITHDMDLTRNDAAFNVLLDANFVPIPGQFGDYRIPIEDPNDPLGPNPIPFNRSEVDFTSAQTEVGGQRPPRRHQINSITSYIDASMVYGSDQVRADALRTFSGGKLKTSQNGQLLPLNTAGLPNADALGLGAQLFLAGDIRANEQLNLTAVHTLFVREHNRLADRIHQLYPALNDEQIYQLARRIVGAEMQVITYEEYLPAIFGHELAPDPEAATYNPNVNAAVTNSFAHAIFRFGHSQINESTLLVNNFNQTTSTLSVRDAFFNPQFLKDDPSRVGRMLKGLASQNGQEVDLLLVDGVRNNLFGPPGAGGLDLAALDIQRGRDHGLPDYNNLRTAYGLPAVTTFAQISSDPAVQAKLAELYGNVDNIDPFVGALAEDHLPGASVGPLIHAVVGNQFERLRDGDRFFYTDDALLNSPEVKAILDVGTVTLSKVIKMNTQIFNIQDDVFFDRSVLTVKTPDAGANISVIATGDIVTVRNNDNGQILAVRSLDSLSQIHLIGSNTASDVFNLFLAGVGNDLEDGVIVSGGSSGGDIMRLYGGFGHDTFNVANASFSTGMVDPLGNDIVRSVSGQSSSVNGLGIQSFGLEKIRIATLTGNDDVNIDPTLTLDIAAGFWFDPNDDA